VKLNSTVVTEKYFVDFGRISECHSETFKCQQFRRQQALFLWVCAPLVAS